MQENKFLSFILFWLYDKSIKETNIYKHSGHLLPNKQDHYLYSNRKHQKIFHSIGTGTLFDIKCLFSEVFSFHTLNQKEKAVALDMLLNQKGLC